jgi:transcriptional regulator with XRE-family HTH domain
MNNNSYSIIEKRKQLGWTIKALAEKTNINYSTLLRIEQGVSAGMDDYIFLIESTLNKALDLPYKKWSYKYDRCEKCGTIQTKHVSRGLCKNCYDRDIEKRHKNVNRIRTHGESSSILTKEYLINNYTYQKKSLSDIAKEANCSRQYVYKVMLSHNIAIRDKSSAREIALDKGKVIRENVSYEGKQEFVTLEKVTLNEGFFSSWSPEMAYVLGVIYTDGNLNHQGGTCNINRVTLSQKDPELLIKTLALMDCDAKIHYRKERISGRIKAGALHWFSIANDKIYNDLVMLGLTPRKSLTLTFPEIPNQYVRHFIRGCWDGDGSVYIEKKINRMVAHFVSGSYKFVESMVKSLMEAGLPGVTIHTNKRETPSYYIKYTGSKVHQLFHYLYNNVPSTQYLERKYILFRQSLDLNSTINVVSFNPLETM